MKRRHADDLDPSKQIPLRVAHLILGCGKTTVYRWVEKGKLKPTYGADGMTVTLAQLRATEAKMVRGRRAKPPLNNVGMSGVE